MNGESPIEITLTPEGSDLAIIFDFQNFSSDEKRLEELTISLLKEIKAGFAPVKFERLAAQDLSGGTQKGMGLEELGRILPGIFKAVLKTPQKFKSLLIFLVNCIPEKAFVIKLKHKRKYLEMKISGFNQQEISVLIDPTNSIIQQFFESKN
ncbi:MAG: hypothetical protein AB4372_20620 [Xenococcus sp. (in: cyanobacteria)]